MNKYTGILSRLPRIKSRFVDVVKLSDEQSSLNNVAEVKIYKRDIMVNLTSSIEEKSVSKTAADDIYHKSPDFHKDSGEGEPEDTIYSGTESLQNRIISARGLYRLGEPLFIELNNSLTQALTKLMKLNSKMLADYLAEFKHVEEEISTQEVRAPETSLAELKTLYKEALAAAAKDKTVIEYSELYRTYKLFLGPQEHSFVFEKCAYLIKKNSKVILEDAGLDAKLDVATPTQITAALSQLKTRLSQFKEAYLCKEAKRGKNCNWGMVSLPERSLSDNINEVWERELIELQKENALVPSTGAVRSTARITCLSAAKQKFLIICSNCRE